MLISTSDRTVRAKVRATSAATTAKGGTAGDSPGLPLDGRAVVVEKPAAVGRAEPGDHLAHAGDRLRRRKVGPGAPHVRSEEHTSELQSLIRISYAVFCLKKNNIRYTH